MSDQERFNLLTEVRIGRAPAVQGGGAVRGFVVFDNLQEDSLNAFRVKRHRLVFATSRVATDAVGEKGVVDDGLRRPGRGGSARPLGRSDA